MRAGLEMALGVGAPLACIATAACSGLLGDFTVGGVLPTSDAFVPPDLDASLDARPFDDAPIVTSDDAGADARDASDDAGYGPTCATDLSANGTHTCAVMGDQSVVWLGA
jgi:acyl dehydratase